ncbi:hypothetical protein MPTK1_4g21940 [Marchantia polymorpha subsp. ruderalis]|uniref:Uncharacterized protein n=2 Tax=Marchantia polymorpha TaxID=3197 RepID=A0AAF6BCG5_MARPO|nr:hypothetical protein MARPO_0090s0028 [Marchantia polymorpha]BBN09699.1 hypothetical protein Mp_4g21940 [Marchantia polymorpha subsp. ruderalis]|eukprot:PTQ33287.1 hypothetical protein MARPO_0090s0028 [Marchantia polymorpha]
MLTGSEMTGDTGVVLPFGSLFNHYSVCWGILVRGVYDAYKFALSFRTALALRRINTSETLGAVLHT